MGSMKDLLGDEQFQFGTPAQHLYRKGAPDTSAAAARKVHTARLEKLVYDAIAEYGEGGVISKQLVERFSELPYSSVTARFKALQDKGLIVCGPDKRDGCRVMRKA